MRFQDKVAVVTGSAVGIGQATLVGFAREGARVVLVDKDINRAQPVIDQLEREEHEVLVVQADITHEDDVRADVGRIKDRLQKLFSQAKETGRPTHELADELARRLVAEAR